MRKLFTVHLPWNGKTCLYARGTPNWYCNPSMQKQLPKQEHFTKGTGGRSMLHITHSLIVMSGLGDERSCRRFVGINIGWWMQLFYYTIVAY